ncbi:hypothetical protein TRFO_08481 [Tritrichomonas foetus]|uniref:Uncharacterized protein n=1 Tax=Tritrichomonas foetus TaxID=1144522 RepID=A0A1J4JJA2_9EUKA|nr:hypothetical protein TRFO_08481 [Tritrichomonas foetus]|eukprot:OHS99234.1 hypothetical protein TRFO_08481 [Tritrichomonas foetus]
MEYKLPPIAPKEEIQKFISNIKAFDVEAQFYRTPKDILAPTSFTVNIYASPQEKSENEQLILKLDSIQSCISFFNQYQLPPSQEIPFSSIPKQIVLITSGQFGLKVCFAAYIRSLSLLIQFLLTKDNPIIDRVNKNLTQKAVEIISSLPVKSLFYPDVYQHPFLDLGIINYQIASPTSVCITLDNIFVGGRDGAILKYSKGKSYSQSRVIYRANPAFGSFSMIFNNDKLYMINQNKNCIIYDLKDDSTTTNMVIPLTYPTISDGFYFYCIVFDLRVRVRIFDKSFERVRKSVKLQIPNSIELSSDMPVSTNGSFINFICNHNCHIFSLLTGKFICSYKIPTTLYSLSFDSSFDSFLCLSNNGLVEIPSRATAPPWMLNFPFEKYENPSYRDLIIDSLSTLAIQYVGGGNDVPLSMFDQSCIASLQALLSSFLRPNEIINEKAVISILCLLQVKIRRYEIYLEQLENDLLKIFTNDKFEFARKAASFLFLSNMPIFENKWSQTDTKILKQIIDDKNCIENVFSFLPLFSFNIPYLEDSLLISILNLTLQAVKSRKFKAVIILSTLQNHLINNLPETESLFTSYITHLMIKMAEQWTAFLSSGSTQTASSTCFIVVKRLELLIMKNMTRINLPLIVTERLFAVSIMQQMGSDEQNLICQQIFNRLLFLALHFAFKAIETTNFVICKEKVACNHQPLQLNDLNGEIDDSDEGKLLLKIVNESNWSHEEDAKKFLIEMKGKVEFNKLDERSKQLEPIQPQPLRKIQYFLLTGEFKSTQHKNSAIFQLMNYAQWIPNSFSKLIFALFLEKIVQFQDDFLCTPKSKLQAFVEKCPVTLLLPTQIIKFSQIKLKEETIDYYDLSNSYQQISECIYPDQSEEFLKPLLTLRSTDEMKMHRALLLALIGVKQGNITLTNELVAKLVHCRAARKLTVVKILLDIVKVFAEKGDKLIFDFIIDTIGCSVMKKTEIFPNAKNVRVMLQFVFEFVEFSRELLDKSADFRTYLVDGLIDSNEVYQTAFFIIVNNLISFPIANSQITAYDSKWNKICEKIEKVTKNGHIITLVDNKGTFDIRTLKEYIIVSPHVINSSIFEDKIEQIADFFNKYEIKNAINSILFYSSLQCMSFSEKFCEKIDGLDQLDAELEPINGKCIVRHFWEFFSQPCSKEILEIYPFANDSYITSPFSTNTPVTINFTFPLICETTLFCFFPTSPYALEYQTVSFADSFSFVLDPDSQQISMTSNEKNVTYPIYSSALFYTICIKSKYISFKIKNKQRLLDKLNSFDCFDFSTFSTCFIDNPKTTINESYQNDYLFNLGLGIRNACLKTIIHNMIKVQPISSDLCVSYLHTYLSHFSKIFKSSPPFPKEHLTILHQNVNTDEIVNKMINKLEKLINETGHSLIWRNNSYAIPIKAGTPIEDCIIIDQSSNNIRVITNKMEAENDCFILPRDHLNRSAIELLMFSKNCYHVCKELNDEVNANKVIQIMQKCEENKLPGFCMSDLKSVDTIIKEINDLYQ